MGNIDLILNEDNYNRLKNEYNKNLSVDTKALANLNSLIVALGNNNFQMTPELQRYALSALSQSFEILNILHQSFTPTPRQFNNNIFEFINTLSTICSHLNSLTIKSAYQILYLKANDILLNCINRVSKYFSNKKIKIFKFV